MDLILSDRDRAALDAIIRNQDDAWGRGDAPAFCRGAAPDLLFTNILGIVGDRAVFDAAHVQIFATVYRGSRLVQTITHVRPVTADVVIVNSDAAVTGYAGLPPGVEADGDVLRTRLEQVFVKRDGAWWIASYHNVDVKPRAVAFLRSGGPG